MTLNAAMELIRDVPADVKILLAGHILREKAAGTEILTLRDETGRDVGAFVPPPRPLPGPPPRLTPEELERDRRAAETPWDSVPAEDVIADLRRLALESRAG